MCRREIDTELCQLTLSMDEVMSLVQAEVMHRRSPPMMSWASLGSSMFWDCCELACVMPS